MHVRMLTMLLACLVVAAPSFCLAQAVSIEEAKELFARFHYGGNLPPPPEVVAAVRDWSKEHPDDADALFWVVVSMSRGLLPDPGVDEIGKMVQRLVELDHAGGMVMAAQLHFMGKGGFPKDDQKVSVLVEETFRRGDPDAALFAGELERVAKDYAEAERFDREAIRRGQVEGWGMLGNLKSIQGEEKEAVEAYRQGAEVGDAKSMYNLARYYIDGIDVERDLNKAHELLAGAALRGMKTPQRLLDRIAAIEREGAATKAPTTTRIKFDPGDFTLQPRIKAANKKPSASTSPTSQPTGDAGKSNADDLTLQPKP